VLLVS